MMDGAALGGTARDWIGDLSDAAASFDWPCVTELIEELPAGFREILVLREMEELSYREIADLLQVPMGTVMSRLARARELLKRAWAARVAR